MTFQRLVVPLIKEGHIELSNLRNTWLCSGHEFTRNVSIRLKVIDGTNFRDFPLLFMFNLP